MTSLILGIEYYQGLYYKVKITKNIWMTKIDIIVYGLTLSIQSHQSINKFATGLDND